jgi:hypothetical protein
MEDSTAPSNGNGQEGGRKKWMALVMAEKRAHPSWSLGQAMKSAKKKYRKSGKKTRRGGNMYGMKGGVDEEVKMGGGLSPLPLNGGRRRKTRSRKH